jgi:3',5'-cyclic AMP phosphodiesterase CpdA
MPHLILPSLSRRAFTLSLAGAGATLLRSAEPEMHWALLSDTHVPENPADAYRGFHPYENLQKVIAEVAASKPQGTLICGDVARLQGLAGDYASVKKLLEPVSAAMPVAMALGNHDDRRNFLAAFGETQPGAQPVKQKHVLVVENALTRLIVLDSNMATNSTPGLLGKAQRTWLAEYLATANDLPTLIFVHHPPDDADGNLLDSPRLFDIVKDQKKVKAIVYGHSHRYHYEMWQGIHLVNLPAVGYNFNDDQPVGWVEARFRREGGAFTLRSFGGNQDRNGKSVVLTWRS